MSRQITVLLADDTLIARAGWSAILNTADDICVVGEAVVVDEVIQKTHQVSPNVVLLDLKWGPDKRVGLRTIPRLKGQNPNTKVIAVSAHDELLAEARQVGADGALPKTFSRQQLLTAIRNVQLNGEREGIWILRLESKASRYSTHLARLEPGRRNAQQYETLIGQVLPFLFGEHLTDFCSQIPHYGREEVWDLVAYNSSNHHFWATLRSEHRVGQVLFELKNVNSLTRDHVLQLVGYLGDPLIDFGLIITRNAPTAGAFRAARRALRRNGVVVLVLSDDEILEMLRVRGRGLDPTVCLKGVYLEFVRST